MTTLPEPVGVLEHCQIGTRPNIGMHQEADIHEEIRLLCACLLAVCAPDLYTVS